MSERSKETTTAMPARPPALPADEKPEGKDSRPPNSERPAAGLNDRWLVPGICVFLAAIVFAVFGQTLGYEFVNFDDGPYVYENPEVAGGLTFRGIIWAFTHVHAFNWHPLTWLSHMLDCQIYGLSPGGHHLTNVLLHAATAILLFLVLRRMMGFLWRSAFVAAVFAIHPLRVESVAWVSERKDVLSGLFFMLTIGAYVRYAQGRSKAESRELSAGNSGLALDSRPSTLDYFLVLFFFALGLMSKPMLVTLPLVLLLLDYWPLGRMTGGECRVTRFGIQVPQLSTLNHLLYEKLPLFGLAAASCVVTFFAQTAVIQSFENMSFPLRVGNASVSCVTYLGQMFWPSGLVVLYPFTAGSVGPAKVVLSLVLLAGIFTGAFVLRRRRPWLLTGWLWYFIMLAPVIGIIKAGIQARADRYTYLPQIGLYLLLTWTVADLCAGWRHRRLVLGGGSILIIAALIFCAHRQTSYWQNSESLWAHTLACTSDNYAAHDMLGDTLLQKKRADEAILQFQKALQIKPDYVEAYINLGNARFQKGEVDEAIACYQQALQLKSDDAEACFNLGNALLQKGRVDEAIASYQTALQLDPGYAEAQNNLGNALLQKGRVDEAIAHFQTALQINPGSPDVLNNLAWLLATDSDAGRRDGREAVRLAERACDLTRYQKTIYIGTLAAAYAEAGRFDDAITTAEKACALASAAGGRYLLEKNQKLLALYRAHQPYHEAAGDFVPAAP